MKKILIIITGSIAASKCYEIISLLNKKYEVNCILTKEAEKYIKLKDIKRVLKGRLYTEKAEIMNKMLHINLSRNNDLILVCPATANSIAKFANGLGDNLASNTLLAANKKIMFVPAMNSHMWLNKSNQMNVTVIRNRGFEFVGPEVGNLKCGEYGLGRISNTKKILESVNKNFQNFEFFKNKKCLVTAGPTIEMIDPIRYISNQSSGKQGYEIASQLALNGAKVILVSGPTNLTPPPYVNFVQIKSTDEMFKKINRFRNIEIGFFAAAVSDYKNKNTLNKKMKKKKSLSLSLVQNIDILKKIGNSRINRPKLVVGFAAETGNINLAKNKLKNKNCDIIIYNKITKKNKIFGSDYNKISIITKSEIKNLKKMTKVNCAKEILKSVFKYQLKNE